MTYTKPVPLCSSIRGITLQTHSPTLLAVLSSRYTILFVARSVNCYRDERFRWRLRQVYLSYIE